MAKEEIECTCGHLDYEHQDAAEYGVSQCFQCFCKEFIPKLTEESYG